MTWVDDLKSIFEKTSVANLVSGISILAGLYILWSLGNTDGVMFIVGGATGYLYGTSRNSNASV